MASDSLPEASVGAMRHDLGESRVTSWRGFAILLAAAFVVRAVFLPWLGGLGLAGDEGYYWGFLHAIQNGRVDRLVLRPPLWSYLVAASRWVHDDPIAARTLSTVAGAFAPPLLYLLGARVFDRRTGLVAAVALMLYPEHFAFSHYLWAECFFTTLLLLVVHLFFLYHEKRGAWLLLGASLLAGIALLSKVFAAIVFGGFVLGLLYESFPGKTVRIAGACLLFLLPVTVYSVVASQTAGRRIVLSETGLLSMRQAVGLDPPGGLEYHPERRDQQRAELMARLRARSLGQASRDARTQLVRLWTPNSFVCKRLLTPPSSKDYQKWQYGLSITWSLALAAIVASVSILVTSLGLAGLCLGERNAFRTFSLLCLAGLCCTAAVAFLASRYRFPFTFLLLLPAVHLVMHPRAHFARMRNPWRLIPLLLILALYASIVLAKSDTIGGWG